MRRNIEEWSKRKWSCWPDVTLQRTWNVRELHLYKLQRFASNNDVIMWTRGSRMAHYNCWLEEDLQELSWSARFKRIENNYCEVQYLLEFKKIKKISSWQHFIFVSQHSISTHCQSAKQTLIMWHQIQTSCHIELSHHWIFQSISHANHVSPPAISMLWFPFLASEVGANLSCVVCVPPP